MWAYVCVCVCVCGHMPYELQMAKAVGMAKDGGEMVVPVLCQVEREERVTYTPLKRWA